MTNPDQSAPTVTRSATPHWIWRTMITGAALTAAANYLIYSRGPGAGWAVFFLMLASGIFINRRNSDKPIIRRLEIGTGLLLAASAVQMTLRPSFSNAIVLFVLTLISSTHFLQDRAGDTPAARKLAEAIRNLLFSPLRWLQASVIVSRDGLPEALDVARKSPSPHSLSRLVRIVVPAGLLVLPFAFLLSSGNGILGQFVSDSLASMFRSLTQIAPPSPARIAFIAVIATATLGLLWRTAPSKLLDRTLDRLGRTTGQPRDHFVARWRTILALVGVNIVFCAANSIDLTFLGSDLELPHHLTVSEYVHEGTNSLIASAIIAAIVLGLLFQQHESVTRSRLIRGLALAWIGQNLLLIVNVARRVEIYVDQYQLSVLRLHLALFLLLVCAGFVLLAIRIQWHKSFGWLVSANLAAVFILFAGIQFWDTRRAVAEFNYARATTEDGDHLLDTYYLAGLGPSAWPTLKKASFSQELTREERSQATQELAHIAEQEDRRAQREDWRDFRWTRHQLRKSLLAVGG